MSEDTASGAGAAGAAAQGAASDKKAGDQNQQQVAAGDKGAQQQQQGDNKGTGSNTVLNADDKASDKAGDKGSAADKDKGADDKGQQQQQAEWRTRLAKGDEKLLKRLERYASEADVATALVHAQDRIAKGIKPGLEPNATPEQIVEYRKLLGVPEKPEEYKIELANGRVVGDADRPMVDAFLKDMHAAHAPPALVNTVLNSYYARMDAAVEAREDADIDQQQASIKELKEDYGAEFKPNMNAVAGLLDQAPAELGKALTDARLPDGTLLFNDPRMVRWMVQLAKDLNPAASIVPGSVGNAAQSLDEKIAAFTALQATRDLTAAENKQHLELIEAKERLVARGVAKAA